MTARMASDWTSVTEVATWERHSSFLAWELPEETMRPASPVSEICCHTSSLPTFSVGTASERVHNIELILFLRALRNSSARRWIPPWNKRASSWVIQLIACRLTQLMSRNLRVTSDLLLVYYGSRLVQEGPRKDVSILCFSQVQIEFQSESRMFRNVCWLK